jgi:hypothetical protein
MKAGSEGDMDIANRKGFPGLHLVYPVEPETLYERADTIRDNNRLRSGDFPQGSPVQMIEMGMGYQDKIDIWKMI